MSEEDLNLTPTPFDGDFPIFEQKGRANGFMSWLARDIAAFLGYSDFTLFKGVLKKAQEALLTLGIEVTEHFNQEITPDGKKDVRMSRFACYLTAMNADNKKRPVAKAQVYFARFSLECQRYLDDVEQLERVVIRKEISKHEKSLSIIAKRSGVDDYALFRNAGYRGLYNMNLSDLRRLKGIPKDRTPLDFMGKTELAANLFWSTQTEERIKQKSVRGQERLEDTAEHVGKTIRKTMQDLSGKRPEDLPRQEDIQTVKKDLKNSAEILKYGNAVDLEQLNLMDEKYLESPHEE